MNDVAFEVKLYCGDRVFEEILRLDRTKLELIHTTIAMPVEMGWGCIL